MKFTLRSRLLVGFAIMFVGLIILSSVYFLSLRRLQNDIVETYNDDFIPFQEISDSYVTFLKWQRAVDRIITSRNSAEALKNEEQARNLRDELENKLNERMKGSNTPEGKSILNSIKQNISTAIQIKQKIADAARQGNVENVLRAEAGNLENITTRIESLMDNFLSLQGNQFRTKLTQVNSETSAAIYMMGIVIFIILLSSVITIVVIYRIINNMLNRVRKSVDELSVSASEIAATTAQLTSNATETGTSITEVTSTVEETRQTALLSNEKAKHVFDSAQKVTSISAGGKKGVSQIIAAIKAIQNEMSMVAQSIIRLSEQTQSVGQIIATVNELAEATNILSVNASIEAARAGEQGRGFSVVAQEIRTLADRSKQATSRIRDILTEIQKATSSTVLLTEQADKKVDTGVQLSTQTGENIEILSGAISEAAQSASQIAASSSQQLAGMDQMANAMNNINLASNQNVSSLKQLEGAMRNLGNLGENLKELVTIL